MFQSLKYCSLYTSISLALLRRQRPNNLRFKHYCICNPNLRNCSLFENSLKKGQQNVVQRILHNSISTIMLHLLNILKSPPYLQYSSLLCLNISVSSLLLKLNMYPRNLLESVYEIDK